MYSESMSDKSTVQICFNRMKVIISLLVIFQNIIDMTVPIFVNTQQSVLCYCH